jgi:hypothetical protein
MGQFKESNRRAINIAASNFLTEQEIGDNYDAYVKLLEESVKGNDDCTAADYVNVWQPLEHLSVAKMIEVIENAIVIEAPEMPEVFKSIDWTDLRTQKASLIEAINFFGDNTKILDNLTGILHLIDCLQDYAVDELGIPEMSVFDFEAEEDRDKSTKEEIFARDSAQRIFEYRVESDGVYVLNYDRGNKLIPRAFMERIFDDRMHADIIKAKIKNQILDDLEKIHGAFETDDDGNYFFDVEMIDNYGGILEQYCREQWEKESKPVVIRCNRCNEKLNPAKAVWLELSNSDGKYYPEGCLPKGHISQGAFIFGNACARTVLTKDPSNYNKKDI